MKINIDGKTYEVIDKIEDAKPGDRLEKLGWIFETGLFLWSGIHPNAVRDILAAGLDRIIREVEEPKVWQAYGLTLENVCCFDLDPNRLYNVKAWLNGTQEPLPSLQEQFPNVAAFVEAVARNVYSQWDQTARELCKEYGL